ncbi:MAG: hypothetical protein GX139_06260 [Armatimonadetes bacterium]|nr:hypothetical protein [Armatimonadota bacterium]
MSDLRLGQQVFVDRLPGWDRDHLEDRGWKLEVRGWEWFGDTGSNFGHLTSDIEKSRFLTSFEMTRFVWLGQRPAATV